jgi:glycosyltransferase A (GT-A) superfamily protein (DUF2064 family)
VTSVIVLAKQPLPGRAKTRLTPPLTPAQAATVAAGALADTLAAAAATSAQARWLAFEGDAAEWLPSGWHLTVQPQGELDVRLVSAFSAVDPRQPAILVGMDTPQFQPAQLEAFEPEHFDACLGLASDGGYWTIGFAEPRRAAAAISGVPMSKDDTGALQLAQLRGVGMRVQLLDELSDFDTFEMACAIVSQVPGGSFARAMKEVRVAHA